MNLSKLMVAAGVALALPVAVHAQAPSVEVQAVDSLNKLYGSHPGFRANHAKGVVAEGSFKASPEAATLSKAILFNGSTIPVTVRFSDNGGIPNVPDSSALANPRGLAINVQLHEGQEEDMAQVFIRFF